MSIDEYENGACGRSCSHRSLGEGGDLFGDGSYVVPWECQHGSWLLQTEAPAGWISHESRSIPIAEWDDPALAASCVAWLRAAAADLSWGEMAFFSDMQRYAAETPQQRADRRQAIAQGDAADNQACIVSKVALPRKLSLLTRMNSADYLLQTPRASMSKTKKVAHRLLVPKHGSSSVKSWAPSTKLTPIL